VIGGFYQYANLLLRDATGHGTSTVLLAVICAGISMWIAWRDVKISARLMLWIEAVSVFVIVTVLVLVLARHGSHLDTSQLRLRGVTGSGLRLGLVLALFSFVGFESATTLGSEARNPLKTIPRAVIQSSILGGAFFTLSAYTEVLGFRVVGQDLGSSDSCRRRAPAGIAHRHRRAGQPVRRHAGLRYGGCARSDAHGSQRIDAPLAAFNARTQ
jgi:amino acid transporter